MQKKMFVLFLCAICAISLFGCTSITLSTTQDADGYITQSLNFGLEDLQGGFSSASKIEFVYDVADAYNLQLEQAYRNRMIELFSNIYDFDALGITIDADKVKYVLSKNPKFLIYNVEFSPNPNSRNFDYTKVTSLSISRTFQSIYAYIMFFHPSAFVFDSESKSIKLNYSLHSTLIDVPSASSSVSKEENLLFTKNIQTCTPFSYDGEEPKLLANIIAGGRVFLPGTTIAEVVCTGLNLSEDQANYVFSFATPFSRVHSNGTTFFENGNYVHFWNLGPNASATVQIYRYYATYATWYVGALLIGVLVLIVGGIATYFVQKHKKKVGLQTLEVIDDFAKDGIVGNQPFGQKQIEFEQTRSNNEIDDD